MRFGRLRSLLRVLPNHIVLGRIVAISAFDHGAHAFDVFPDVAVGGVALVAQVGQLRLQRRQLARKSLPIGQLVGEGRLRERARFQSGVNPLPAFVDGLRLLQHVGWKRMSGHKCSPAR